MSNEEANFLKSGQFFSLQIVGVTFPAGAISTLGVPGSALCLAKFLVAQSVPEMKEPPKLARPNQLALAS